MTICVYIIIGKTSKACTLTNRVCANSNVNAYSRYPYMYIEVFSLILFIALPPIMITVMTRPLLVLGGRIVITRVCVCAHVYTHWHKYTGIMCLCKHGTHTHCPPSDIMLRRRRQSCCCPVTRSHSSVLHTNRPAVNIVTGNDACCSGVCQPAGLHDWQNRCGPFHCLVIHQELVGHLYKYVCRWEST